MNATPFTPPPPSPPAGTDKEKNKISINEEQVKGKAVSPVTREELESRTLVPNLNLKVMCAEYRARHQRSSLAATSPEGVVMEALLSSPPEKRSVLAAGVEWS